MVREPEWQWPDLTKPKLGRMGRDLARGLITRQECEYLVSVLIGACPQQQRGKNVENMLGMVKWAHDRELHDRSMAASEITADIKPLFVRERPKEEIRAAAEDANRKWSREPWNQHSVLADREVLHLVKEEWLAFQYDQGRRKRWA